MTVVAHHIALDGLSFATIVSDLVAAYDARADGRSPIWPSPALDYRDYSAWHRTILGDPADPQSLAGRQLEFWSDTLAGVLMMFLVKLIDVFVGIMLFLFKGDRRRSGSGTALALGSLGIFVLVVGLGAALGIPKLWYNVRTSAYTAELANASGLSDTPPTGTWRLQVAGSEPAHQARAVCT